MNHGLDVSRLWISRPDPNKGIISRAGHLTRVAKPVVDREAKLHRSDGIDRASRLGDILGVPACASTGHV